MAQRCRDAGRTQAARGGASQRSPETGGWLAFLPSRGSPPPRAACPLPCAAAPPCPAPPSRAHTPLPLGGPRHEAMGLIAPALRYDPGCP